MDRNVEGAGFGRGQGVDRKSRLRSELTEIDLEKEEESREIELGLSQFAVALRDCREGGNYASDYAAVHSKVNTDALQNPKFWTKVFRDYRGYVMAHGIFAGLSPELQSDPEIQSVFFHDPSFNIYALPRNSVEKFDRDDVVADWIEGNGPARNAPWHLFTPEEKRIFVIKKVEHTGNDYSRSFQYLASHRDEFREAIPDDEWRELVIGRYRANPNDLTRALDENFDETIQLIPLEVLREQLTKPSPYRDGKPDFISVDLPKLKQLAFDDEKIAEWKNEQESRSQLAQGFSGFDKMSPEDRIWALSLVSKRAEHFPGYRSFLEDQLPKSLQKLPPGIVDHTLKSLDRLLRPAVETFRDEHHLRPNEFADEIIRPTMDMQGASAFRTFDTLNEMTDVFDAGSQFLCHILLPNVESAKVFRQLMSKTGARFNDFIEFYLELRFGRVEGELKGFGRGGFENEKNLVTYVDSGLPWVEDVFTEFEKRLDGGERVKVVIAELSEQVRGRIDQIRDGEWPEDGLDDKTKALVTHVFPPALGVSREEYSRLIERREDRQNDIPYELYPLLGKEIAFSLGNWELEKGQEFGVVPWDRITEVIAGINKKKIVTEPREALKLNELLIDQDRTVEIGRAMIGLLTESSEASTKHALRDLYGLFLARGGAKLPEYVAGREEATRLTEWAKDTLRDTVDASLNAYRASDPERFDKEVAQATHREITPKARKNIAGAIAGVMRSDKFSDENKSERIRSILEGAGIVIEGDVLGSFREIVSRDPESIHQAVDDGVRDLLEGSRGVAKQAGKISSTIASKVLGAEAATMKREMDKWQFIEGAEGGAQRTLQFEITKKKLHAAAGMNMGVCVAVDEQLWNKPEFMNVVLFADDGVARGGMHFEIVRYEGKKYLSLPGINPNATALREVDAEKLTNAMLNYAKECAKAIGAVSVLIPTNPNIFSNRAELHGIISALKLPIKSLKKPHQFSYSPFAYEWQDAYEIGV